MVKQGNLVALVLQLQTNDPAYGTVVSAELMIKDKLHVEWHHHIINCTIAANCALFIHFTLFLFSVCRLGTMIYLLKIH